MRDDLRDDVHARAARRRAAPAAGPATCARTCLDHAAGRVAEHDVERNAVALDLHVLRALRLHVVSARDRVDELGERCEDILVGECHGGGWRSGAERECGREARNFKAICYNRVDSIALCVSRTRRRLALRPEPSANHFRLATRLHAPQAFRHDGASLRQRPVPHRPHHGVHPGRHLGALPAAAGAQGALRVRRRHPWRADHAQGRGRGHHARGAHRAAWRSRTSATSRASGSASTTSTPRTPTRTAALPAEIFVALQGGGLHRHEDDRAVLRPGEGHVPARPLHQGRVPEMRRQGPVRGFLRGLRRRVRADRPEEPLLRPHRRHAGDEEVRALLLQALGPALRRVPARAGRRTASSSPRSPTRCASGSTGASTTGTSPATPRTSGSRSRAPRASTSTSGWTRPSATSPSLKSYLEKKGQDFAKYLADPKLEQIHFIGKDIIYFHTLFWPAMLKFSGRKVPDNVFVHGFITLSGEKMSKSRGVSVSPQKYAELGLNPEWLRYYLAAKLNARVEDLDFNPDDFLARVNSDLVGKYVNIASRAAGFISKRFNGRLSEEPLSAGRELKHKLRGNVAAPVPDNEEQVPGDPLRGAELRRPDRRRLRRARVQQGHPPGDVPRRPREPVRGRAEAVGNRQGAGPGRGAAVVLHALPRALPHPHHLPEARAAEGRRGRRGLPRAREAPRLGRRRATR